MLRTICSFRDRVVETVATAAEIPRGTAVSSGRAPVELLAEVAMRAHEAVFDAKKLACYAIAVKCGSGQEAGVASWFDVTAGRRFVVCSHAGGSWVRRQAGYRTDQGHCSR